MKKLLFTAIIAVSLTSSGFAAPKNVGKVSHFITSAFKNDFTDASNVKWDITEKFVRASFMNGEMATEAYYSLNGDFIGSSHAVNLSKLPTPAKRTIAKKYADYNIIEAIEFDGVEENAFFIKAENDKKSVILKVQGYNVDVIKSSKK